MNTLNYSEGCDWAWGCDRGALRGRRPVPPLRLPVAAPSSSAIVFRFGDWVNDHMAERRGGGGGSGRPDDALSLRPAAREAG